MEDQGNVSIFLTNREQMIVRTAMVAASRAMANLLDTLAFNSHIMDMNGKDALQLAANVTRATCEQMLKG
jgi:hypothetical protein